MELYQYNILYFILISEILIGCNHYLLPDICNTMIMQMHDNIGIGIDVWYRLALNHDDDNECIKITTWSLLIPFSTSLHFRNNNCIVYKVYIA